MATRKNISDAVRGITRKALTQGKLDRGAVARYRRAMAVREARHGTRLRLAHARNGRARAPVHETLREARGKEGSASQSVTTLVSGAMVARIASGMLAGIADSLSTARGPRAGPLMLRGLAETARDLGRVQEIGAVLLRYGFGDLVRRLGIVLHWKEAAQSAPLNARKARAARCRTLVPRSSSWARSWPRAWISLRPSGSRSWRSCRTGRRLPRTRRCARSSAMISAARPRLCSPPSTRSRSPPARSPRCTARASPTARTSR